jgi:hypothetical protein
MASTNALKALKTAQTFTPAPVDQEVIDWCEREYTEYVKRPTAWREITFPNATEMDEVIKDATKYLTEQRETPLTFQRKNGFPVVNADGTALLVYRVRDKMLRGSRSSNGSASANGSAS